MTKRLEELFNLEESSPTVPPVEEKKPSHEEVDSLKIYLKFQN